MASIRTGYAGPFSTSPQLDPWRPSARRERVTTSSRASRSASRGDGDGISDGDEVRLYSNPRDDKSSRQSEPLIVDRDLLRLDCGATKSISVLVEEVQEWSTSTDVRWLGVTAGETGPGQADVTAKCGALPAGVTPDEC